MAFQMAPVPPFTVRMPASFRITSFGDVQPDGAPVSLTPISFGHVRPQASPAIPGRISTPSGGSMMSVTG